LPLVFTVHSTEFDRSAGFAPQAWIEDIERSGVHAADRVIAVSRYTKGLVETLYGADPNRVVAVHNGVNLKELNDARIRDYDTQRGNVLFLSRLSRQKGPLYFLQAARRVLEKRLDARFIVAGKGEMLAECIDYVLTNGMANNVRFTGFVPSHHIADLYTQNEIYVLPSVSEPFGISILEAMATGLPTIVSKTTGVGEALNHVLKADYWDIDEMADMILHLLEYPMLREELGRNGAREVRKFSWKESCRITHKVYEDLLASRSAPSAWSAT
jgi:glycosyltransferase involved in cell wall biosynthesis